MDADSFSAIISFVQGYYTLFTTFSVVTGLSLAGAGLVRLNRRRHEGGGPVIGFSGIAIGGQ
jgi:hypothetical protein